MRLITLYVLPKNEYISININNIVIIKPGGAIPGSLVYISGVDLWFNVEESTSDIIDEINGACRLGQREAYCGQ